MSCCAAMTPEMVAAAARRGRAEELKLASQTPREGVRLLRLAAPDLKCGACVASVERALLRAQGVLTARANLTAKTVAVEWRETETDAAAVVEAIEAAGQRVFALDDASADDAEAAESRDLLTRMAVAGFAAANVMLLSVAVWSGAEGATRDLMHWISAMIALPAVVYAGRPFFVSALSGLRAGRLTMDAPISLAVILAAGVSLWEVYAGGPETYFDAAVSLLFLLLLGRWLDKAMRARARSAARALARLAPRGAWALDAEGRAQYRPIEEIGLGDRLRVGPGDRIPVDGVVIDGTGGVDRSFLTGESAPQPVAPGARVEAGALALDAGLTIRATAVGEDTTLAEIGRLVAAAEERKSRLARLADQAARIYAPLVHVIALVVMLAWLALGSDPREALLVAVALLIVTCPCALGLAAPMAQAVASGALYRRGVMLKDGAALERLATIRSVAFDKTGVLTLGRPRLTAPTGLSAAESAAIGALAAESRHPLSRAIAAWSAARDGTPERVEAVREYAGQGVAGVWRGAPIRLGSAAFVGAAAETEAEAETETETETGDTRSVAWVRIGAGAARAFRFEDADRPGAAATAAAFQAAGLRTAILSGDRPAAVDAVADRLGVADRRAGLTPEQKIAAVAAAPGPALMIGDGVNDAPALAAAAVSMAPASAADIGRAAADLVFTGERLDAAVEAWKAARATRAVILQNFGLAALYNAVAIPLAALGYAGPLEAAIAMSTSSLLVTLNALRLAAPPRAAVAVEQGAAL